MIDGFSTRDGRNKDTQSSVVELTHMSDELPNTDSPGRRGGVSVGPKTLSQEVTERRWHVSTQRNLAGRPLTHSHTHIYKYMLRQSEHSTTVRLYALYHRRNCESGVCWHPAVTSSSCTAEPSNGVGQILWNIYEGKRPGGGVWSCDVRV